MHTGGKIMFRIHASLFKKPFNKYRNLKIDKNGGKIETCHYDIIGRRDYLLKGQYSYNEVFF